MSVRFGEFELQPERYRLLRDGEEVRLEPKVFELLVYLVGQRGRVVTKDELVQEVWEGKFVTEAALSRAVHAARRALGDSGRSARWIITVHGRGYRFLDEVEDEARQETVPAPRRWPVVVAWAAAAVGLAAAGLLLVARRSPEAEAPQAQPPILAMAGLSVSDPDLALIGLSIDDLVASRLEAVPGLTLRRPLYAASAADASLAETAERAGAAAVLAGRLSPSVDPDRVEVEMTLHEASTSGLRATPLGSYSLPRLRAATDFGDFLALREAIASRVVGLLVPAVALPEPAGTLVPRDPTAYRYYLLAYQHLLDGYCTGTRPAAELLGRSLEIDPDFAPAWLYLAVAHYNQIWACGGDASHLAPAMEAVDHAIELAPDLLAARCTRISWLIEEGRVEDAWEETAGLLVEAPEDPTLLTTAAYALRFAGELEASQQALDKLLSIDPLVFAAGAPGGSPATYLYRGDLERFLATLPTLDMPYFRYLRGLTEHLRGNDGTARQVLEPAFRSGPGAVFGRLSQALLAVLDGDPDAARRIVTEVSRQRDTLGSADGEITYKQAQILVLAGAREAALVELGKAVDQGFFCGACFRLDPIFEPLAGDAAFEAIVDRAEERGRRFSARFGGGPGL